MQTTRMVLIRHGETDWNVARRVQGHIDIGLNATGRTQARRMAAALATRDALTCIYSSDLSRALDTARALAQATQAPLVPLPALRERHFGDFQGMSFACTSERFPEQAWHWRHRTPTWAPPGGGESLMALRQRIIATVDALGARHAGEQIAIVTHGGVLDIIYRAATHLGLQDARSWTIANATINRVLWTPSSGLALVGWNDAAHLQDATLDETVT